MIALALVAALATPLSTQKPRAAVELGVGGGLGSVAETPTWLVRPWFGVAGFGLDLSLQAPLRLSLDDRTLRERDWDETADLGRVVRFVRLGEAVTVGSLVDVTLGHGTLVRRYHNGIDDDHHRLGVYARLPPDRTGWPVGLEAFVDHVLAPPVLGGRAWYGLADGHFELGGTLALDTWRPTRLTGGQDAVAWPNADFGPLLAAGLDAGWTPWLGQPWAVTATGDLNLRNAGLGLHLGARGHVALADAWRLEAGAELILAGAEYDWAPFDTGWLVDRWRFAGDRARLDDGALAGRLFMIARLQTHAEVGLEYADANAPGRRDLSAWTRLPFERAQVRAFWRQRGRGGVLDGDSAMAAVSTLVPLNRHWSVGGNAARMWRVPAEGEAYAPITEFMLVIEAGTQL
ncbi:MAG: hypothetical protein H6702_19935 [Myxococcales bacterium]|nr:hypothetical protein [Myxococcales bacterium]